MVPQNGNAEISIDDATSLFDQSRVKMALRPKTTDRQNIGGLGHPYRGVGPSKGET